MTRKFTCWLLTLLMVIVLLPSEVMALEDPKPMLAEEMVSIDVSEVDALTDDVVIEEADNEGTEKTDLDSTTDYFEWTESVALKASTSGTCGDSVRWTLSNGVLTISGSGAMWNYSSSPWSAYSVTSATVGSGVTTIGSQAFCGCSALKTVSLPSSVTAIQYAAFGGCYNLQSVTMSSKVKTIADWAFGNCISLQSISIPSTTTYIGAWAFENCFALSGVTIPDSVTQVDAYAFKGAGVKTAKLSSGLKEVPFGMFLNCSSLQSVTLSSSTTAIDSCAFCGCSSLQSISLPSGVTEIQYGTFGGCTALKTVTMPSKVKTIADWAFGNCISLQSITIPSTATSIGEFAFGNCVSLSSITVPDSVTWIGSYAFEYSGIKTAKLSSGLQEVPFGLFNNCKNLQSVTLPDTVTAIDGFVFRGCSSLTSIDIPCGVTIIGEYAFSNCTSLADVYYSGTQVQWNSVVFGVGNTELETAEVHFTGVPLVGICGANGDNVTCILEANGVLTIRGSGAMADYDNLTDIPWYNLRSGIAQVVICDGITKIGLCDFNYYACESKHFLSISIPASVKTISDCAFWACASLTDVYYAGTPAQWGAIVIGDDNQYLTGASRHYTRDLNGDNNVTVTDMEALYDYLASGKVPTAGVEYCDVNGDDDVNILDYQALYEMVKQ